MQDTFMTVVSNGIPFHARLVKQGETYGLNRCLTHDKSDSMVEFYDARYVKGFESLGQFVSRYYVKTLLDTTWGDARRGLNLQSDIPDWYIDTGAMTKVFEWLEWIID